LTGVSCATRYGLSRKSGRRHGRALRFFHYIEEEHEKVPFDWKEFLRDLFLGYRLPLFIPSVFAEEQELVVERAELRTRRMESMMMSILAHALIVSIVILLIHARVEPLPGQEEKIVFVNQPVYFPFESTGPEVEEGVAAAKASRHRRQRAGCRTPRAFNSSRPIRTTLRFLCRRRTCWPPLERPDADRHSAGSVVAYRRHFGPAELFQVFGSGLRRRNRHRARDRSRVGNGPRRRSGQRRRYGGGSGGGSVPAWALRNRRRVKAPVAIYMPLPAYTEEARKSARKES